MLISPPSMSLVLWTAAAALSMSPIPVQAGIAGHQPRSRQHMSLKRSSLNSSNNVVSPASLSKRGDYSGTATYYDAETGQAGACGWMIGNGDWSVAIKGSMYGNYGVKSSWCGQKITISANGKTARNVVIADACPGCQGAGGLDLTPGLFEYFISKDAGVVPITWHLSSEDGNGGGGGGGASVNIDWNAQQAQKDEEARKKKEKEEQDRQWAAKQEEERKAKQWEQEEAARKKKEQDDNDARWKAQQEQEQEQQQKAEADRKWKAEQDQKAEAERKQQEQQQQQSSSSSMSQQNDHGSSQGAQKAVLSPGSLWIASAVSTAGNSSSTASANSTTSSNSTSAIATLLRGNSTVPLPSGAILPAKTGTSQSKSYNGSSSSLEKGTPGNLGRTAQVVLDLAGLAYAAAARK